MLLRSLIASALLFSISAVGNGDDSIKSILSEAKHVGLAVNEQLSTFTLHLYSRAEFVTHTELLTKFNARTVEYAKTSEDLHAKAILDGRIRLCTITKVGDDYITLSGAYSAGKSVLIPLNRIGQLVMDE